MSKTPVVNAIVERGFVPSPEEYELISHLLAEYAAAAKEKGHPEIRKRIMEILGRLSHVVQAPGGLREDQIERYWKLARRGLEERDSKKLVDAVQDLIAGTLRTDPDPAEKIAQYLLKLVADLMMDHRASDFAVLERLSVELDAARTEWDSVGWPPTHDVLAWLGEMIEIGKDNLAAGRVPWPTEEEPAEEPDA